MKIQLSSPASPRQVSIDTEVMTVHIQEAFIGPTFVTPDGEELTVIMRDGGFELTYEANGQTRNLTLVNGGVSHRGRT